MKIRFFSRFFTWIMVAKNNFTVFTSIYFIHFNSLLLLYDMQKLINLRVYTSFTVSRWSDLTQNIKSILILVNSLKRYQKHDTQILFYSEYTIIKLFFYLPSQFFKLSLLGIQLVFVALSWSHPSDLNWIHVEKTSCVHAITWISRNPVPVTFLSLY